MASAMIYSKRLIAAALFLNIAVGCVAWYSLQYSRSVYEEKASVATHNLSALIVRDIGSEYERADQAMRVVADEYERQIQARSPSVQGLNALIQRQLVLHPALISIRITDRAGNSIYGFDGSQPPPGSNISERAYFAKLRDVPDAGLVISEPVLGKISGKWGVSLARRLNGLEGEFNGIVFAFLDHAAFQKKLLDMPLEAQASIAIRDGNLGLIARVPPFSDERALIGSKQFSSAFRDALNANSVHGTYEVGANSIDGVARLHTYRRHPDYPFVVNVGVARNNYLSGWYIDVKTTLALFVIFATVTGLVTWLLIVAWRRRDQTEEALTSQNARLAEVIWSADFGYWDANLETGAVTASSRCVDMLGYSLQELARTDVASWGGLVHPEDAIRNQRLLKACLAGENDFYESEYRIRHQNGTWLWVLDRGRIVARAADGQPIRMSGTQQDISNKKNADERQLHAVLESAPDGMLIVNADGSIQFANRMSTSILGYSNSELCAMNVDQLVPDALRAGHAGKRLLFQINPQSRSGKTLDNLRAQRKDGVDVPVDLSLSTFVLNGDTVVIASLADISSRLAAQRALTEGDTKLRKAQEIAGFGSYMTNLVTGQWESSAQLDAIFGIDEHFDHNIPNWNSLLHPDYQQAALDHYLEVIRDRSDFRMDYEIVRPVDGVRRWVAANGELEYAADGTPLRLIGTIQDITERKKIEADLQKSHDLLRKVSEQVPGVLFQFKMAADGAYSAPFASSGLLEMFGLYPDQIEQDASELFLSVHPDDVQGFATSILESAKTLRHWTHEFRVNLGGGLAKWRQGHARPEVQADGSVLWHGIVSDASERVEARQQLLLINESLENRVLERTQELIVALGNAELATKIRGEFLANMSHEIRTPMNAVLGLTHLALKANPDSRLRELLLKIMSSAEHLLGVINDILDYSKIDARKVTLEVGNFDLSKMIWRNIQMIEDKAQEKGLAVILSIDDNVPRALRGDSLRLGQILINFINNAIKFTHKGSVTVHVSCVPEVSADLQANECMLRFEVQDTGLGIAPEQIERLFQSFEQGDRSTTRKFGGTGLGLAISKQLAHLMGGDVGVSTEVGVGSTFWFTARLQLATEIETQTSRVVIEEKVISRLRGAKVLVVDDNTFNLEVARGMLEEFGIDVYVANNGAEAIDQLKLSAFDSVLMDIQMPVMDGLEATRRIRNDPMLAKTVVIAMTANALREDRESYIAAGMNDVVIKPIRPELLIATLGKWLAGEDSKQARVHAADLNPSAQLLNPSDPGHKSQALAVWDISFLIAAVGDSSATLERLLRKFLLTATEQCQSLELAYKQRDRTTVMTLAHKVKSAARAVGAMQLGQCCEDLEMSTQPVESESWQMMVEGLLRAFQASRIGIVEWLDAAEYSAKVDDK